MLWSVLFWSCTGSSTDDQVTKLVDTPSPTGDSGPTVETGPVTTTSDTGGTSDPCPAPALEIGNGAVEHTPLQKGAEVTIVHGSQGGWHIEISGRITGTGELVGISSSVVRVSDGVQLAGEQPPWYVELLPLPTDACAREFAGLQSLIDDLPLPPEFAGYQEFICSLDGEALELSSSVVDLTTATGVDPIPDAEASIQVVARLDDFDAMYNCP
ncbi:MAG TPA: hypothetical protein ENK18_01165 [Deltaproteobacteria bacterium]|nr:hypothetical protein [Deltaproteobacteria bacterium]